MMIRTGYECAFDYRYVCNKCGAISMRSIGDSAIECECGGDLICTDPRYSEPVTEEKKDYAEILKQYRQLYTLTQQEVAAKLGISRSYLVMLEKGRREFTLELMKKVVKLVS